MLPSLGFNEIVILGILALVVVGPKDLPLLFRKLGQWTAKLRGMAQEFRTGFDELARQAELDELKREVDALRRTTSLQEIRSELNKPLPTLEDYAGIKSQPAIPTPPYIPAVEAPVEAPAVEVAVGDIAAEQAADVSEAPKASAGVPEHIDVAPIARGAS
ncbi:MAG: twin-arginine translocase subunit TatB [Hyphomonadaceae bacterium]|nr:twin-arginine translocase subunit TatB [Hyphomonadaceae bacterium]